MTDGTEHILGGVLFCIAIALLLRLHGMYTQQVKDAGKEPNRVILFEQTEG